MSPERAKGPACRSCGSADLFGPAPIRTSAHPNSSSVLVETPGAHFHDHPLQGRVCLACGTVDLVLSPPTLAAFREEVRPRPGRRAR
jgi:hypothetical protein